MNPNSSDAQEMVTASIWEDKNISTPVFFPGITDIEEAKALLASKGTMRYEITDWQIEVTQPLRFFGYVIEA